MTSFEPEGEGRFLGAILGMAIGDALAFAHPKAPPASADRARAWCEDFMTSPQGRFETGQFSDDTQLMLCAAESLVRERRVDGHSIAAHLAWAFTEGILLSPSEATARAAKRLAEGAPWMSAGEPIGVADASGLSRSLVVGLWTNEDTSRLAHDAYVATVVTHKDPVCAAAAAAFAKAVSLCRTGYPSADAYCEATAQAASFHDPAVADEIRQLPRVAGWQASKALAQLCTIGVRKAELPSDGGLPAHPLPTVLVALYATIKKPGDFREALELVFQAGGEIGTAAALVGGILGGRVGTPGLPPRLRQRVAYKDHLQGVASRLWNARHSAAPATVPAYVGLKRRK